MPKALLEAGEITKEDAWKTEALASLQWIGQQQRSEAGYFRPVGSAGFGMPHTNLPFDQQPVESWAAIDAAASAYASTGNGIWLEQADIAWRWFFGGNDRGVVLADLKNGRCRDGITPHGANENCGAESILAFHLASHAMINLAQIAQERGLGIFFGEKSRKVDHSKTMIIAENVA